MAQNTEIHVKSSHIYITITILILLLAASFSLGVAWGKINSRFQYHELPLKSGGIALIVPDKWQVVTEWDKHGRPYIKPTDMY
jgi:hypothetical protein